MENQERVLAYSLAKTITHAELEEVSGGMAHMTSRPSGSADGSSSKGWDTHIDMVLDW